MLKWIGDSLYAGKYWIFEESDLNYLKSFEKNVAFSQSDLFEIFPEAKKIIEESLKEAKGLLELKNEEIRSAVVMVEESGRSLKWFYEMCLENRKHEYALLKKSIIRMEFIVHPREISMKFNDSITAETIDKAKEVLITDYIEVNSAGFAKCPLHNEKSGSFKYYKDTNRWWCYSENIGGDVIDLIGKMYKLTFIESIKYLLKK